MSSDSHLYPDVLISPPGAVATVWSVEVASPLRARASCLQTLRGTQ